MCSCIATSTTTRLRFLCIAGILVVMGGCEATHPVAAPADMHSPSSDRILAPSYLEATPGSGLVSVTRDAGSQYRACDLQVRVAGQPVALLRTSEKVILHLSPGKHVVSVTGDEGGNVCGPGGAINSEMQAVQITAAPAHPVDVRVGFDSTGRIHIATQP